MKTCCLYVLAFVSVVYSQNLNSRGYDVEEYEAIDNINTNDIVVNSSRQCGGEALTTATGNIQYKLSEPLGENERCIWTIVVPAATGFAVGIFSLGFPEPTVDHQLQITSFDGDNEPKTIIPDHLGMYDLNRTSMLLVTFFTGSGSTVINFTGFFLEYTTYFNGNPSPPYSTYSHFYNASREYSLRRGINTANSTQIFVYNWGDKTFNSRNTMKMFFEREEGWTSATRLEVYIFHPESSWELQNVLDVKTNPTLTMETNDILFFAFRRNDTAPTQSVAIIVNFSCLDMTDRLH